MSVIPDPGRPGPDPAPPTPTPPGPSEPQPSPLPPDPQPPAEPPAPDPLPPDPVPQILAGVVTIDVLDPATGELLEEVPCAGQAEVDAAVRAARAAQPAWARPPAGERAGVLKRAARRLAAHVEELALLQTRENGRPLAESRAGVEAGVGAIEQYAELGPLHRGRSLAGNWDASEIGPLIDERQLATVARQVDEALDAGAALRAGARRLPGPGCFYAPTVLTGARDDMAVMAEETFGPVAAIRVVGSFDDALEAANATPYGLAATVLTPSAAHAQRAWRELRAGTVKVNAVWGGAPGGGAEPAGVSGTGFGYGPELLDEVTRTKVVHLEPAPG